jgi:hypothetical protein
MGRKLIDLTGQRFGKLLVLEYDREHKRRWKCQCDCGNIAYAAQTGLRCGDRISCGCNRKGNANNGTRHRRLESYAYYGAKKRCVNPYSKSWKDYGGRGIKFLFTSFQQFLAEIGPKPTPKHQLDRINNDGHYEPGNIRWATPKENANNRRCSKPRTPPPLLALMEDVATKMPSCHPAG